MPTNKEIILGILYGQPPVLHQAYLYTFRPQSRLFDVIGRFLTKGIDWSLCAADPPHTQGGDPPPPPGALIGDGSQPYRGRWHTPDTWAWWENANANRYNIWPDDESHHRDYETLKYVTTQIAFDNLGFSFPDNAESDALLDRMDQAASDGLFYDPRPGTTAPAYGPPPFEHVPINDPWLSYFNGDWGDMPRVLGLGPPRWWGRPV